jgi:aspartate/methionine/tyrosine aminotransferase
MRITDEIARRRAAGEDVISLCAGEPAPRPITSALEPMGYTGPIGTHDLREAIAQHYTSWYGVDLDPARVAVTTGSSGAFLLASVAMFDPGDRVALVSPGYPAYRNILTALGVDAIDIATDASTRFQPTVELLDETVVRSGRLAGLVVASPANPTGTMLDRDDLSALVTWCRANGTRLISDEIYHGIAFPPPGSSDPRGVTVAEFDDEAVVLNSFSKYWGMTGWRLGWTVLPAGIVPAVEALASNFALSPPSPAQQLALSAFGEDAYAERDAVVADFARARRLFLDAAPRLGWGVAAPADGAFYYYSELGDQLTRYRDSSAYALALLEHANVAVVPGNDFDPAHGHRAVRLSYAAGEAVVAEAIERIVDFQARAPH